MRIVIIFFCLFVGIILLYLFDKRNKQKQEKCKIKKQRNLVKSGYIKPVLKNLTQEQIDDIHARGKITPAEKVKEWEGADLCAPGDTIGSAAWRCKKFHHNCHDCLVDYANEHDEYTSFADIIKKINFYL